ncbi:MAG: branched-chain amino acid transaminase [Gemmatimonadaceae bacterium]|jgi:branched-chain amino acid aminotransferase|nr:branched-chain amino acid transaminase [Gemmatimonadaceae bacterium]MCC6431960.1 branched-chain amino acid transaminase [Gemmatimonadaceae bacterium]
MAGITATDFIWKNGEFIKWEDAQVHVLSHSMQFGSAAFEGIRCYSTPKGPAIFRLREHVQRLINSVKIYRITLEYSLEQLMAAHCEVVVRNKMEACYIRPMVVRGYGASGMVPFESPIDVYVPCWPWGAYLGDDALENGVDACVSSWNRMAPNTVPSLAKIAGNYLSGQLVKMEALTNGFAEGIALGPGGTVSEGSGQNVFLVSNGTLITTPLDGTLLGGITRASIIELAGREGIPVREQQIPREMLYTADEVFFTGTAAELTPVRSVDRIAVGAGKPGPVTKHVQKAFLDIAHGRADDTFGWLTHVR